MTPLTRPVTRETRQLHRGRALVVQLETGGHLIRIREKGRRQWFTLTYTQALYVGAKNEAARIKAEKLAAKKARKAGR